MHGLTFSDAGFVDPAAMKCLDNMQGKLLSDTLMAVADPSSWPLASKARIASWRKLTTRKGRENTGSVLVEGVRLVGEALLSGCVVDAFLAVNDSQGLAAAGRVVDFASRWTGSVARIPRKDFKGMTDTVHSAGVVAVVQWRPQCWDSMGSKRPRRLLFCDAISDPGNLGALIRTAAGLGLDGVIAGPGCVETTNPKTIRATAGAVFRIPIHTVPAVESFAEWCRRHQYTIFVADSKRKAGTRLRSPRQPKRWALVIGGETRGLHPAWSATDVRWMHIPMRRQVESLNAAVAGAILMDRLCCRG